MFSVISFFILGFLFGLKHAFEPDHLAAVSFLASHAKTKRQAAIKGISWGMGHTLTLLLIGFLVFSLGIHMPKNVSDYFEIVVSFLLITLGIYGFVKFFKSRRVTATQVIHDHPPLGLHRHALPSFFVGMVHGLAGSGVILALFVATFQSSLLALSYLLFFGGGSILGMGLISLLIGGVAMRFKNALFFGAATFSFMLGFLRFMA